MLNKKHVREEPNLVIEDEIVDESDQRSQPCARFDKSCIGKSRHLY